MDTGKEIITRLEAADTEELARLVAHPTLDAEKALRTYLGDKHYQHLHSLAIRREMMHSTKSSKSRPNVIIIPGMFGSELTSIDLNGNQERMWLSPRRIVAGQLDRLRLDANGLTELDPNYTIKATGIMKRYYGELMLTLAETCNVRAFWYDWRKNFKIAAAQLRGCINTWFGEKESFHIIAHGEGGLVARSYIALFGEQWARHDGRLIMLGTPNQGLVTALMAITGHLGIIRWLNQLDPRRELADSRMIAASFPSLYQLLPSPCPNHGMDALYEPTTYAAAFKIAPEQLAISKEQHELLHSIVDPKRMIVIAGYNQPTFVTIDLHALKADPFTINPFKIYKASNDGDGTVACEMALLKTDGDCQVPTCYIKATHGNLHANPKVLGALTEMLTVSLEEKVWHDFVKNKGFDLARDQENFETGKYLFTIEPELMPEVVAGRVSAKLSKRFQENGEPLTAKATLEMGVDSNHWTVVDTDKKYLIRTKHQTLDVYTDINQLVARAWQRNTNELETLARRVDIRGGKLVERSYVTPEERSIERNLMRQLISGQERQEQVYQFHVPFAQPTIKINLVQGDIVNADELLKNGVPIDAIAVGHYRGGKPYGAIKALDTAISVAVTDSELLRDPKGELLESELLMTQYAQRGIIRGELAQPFLLNDPRPAGKAIDRLIAVAGMGMPGRFGVPELTVLVRELCWTLGRIGKKHLATVLIGTGLNNLSVTDAVAAWIRGIKNAITGIDEQRHYVLHEITLVEEDPSKVIAIDEALKSERDDLKARKRMTLVYQHLSPEKIKKLRSEARRFKADIDDESPRDPAPTRITVELEGNTYRFGAITDSAAIPERPIVLDPKLVMAANDELAAAGDPGRQLRLGQFMQRLLIPEDLRDELSSTAPLVMMLDSTTARIHWELLAQLEPMSSAYMEPLDKDRRDSFLGTSRGFTRQLRTTFAPPPEPPPPTKRILRVLVVADPAADAHLPGAEEEGIAIADLFERFNLVTSGENRVEVVRLLGPHDATRTTVLRHLMTRTYDVLHFAGHCFYNKENPGASGWIFTGDERLTANEFRRIDRVPQFVFSNACESGITPDRAGERSVNLAPILAESFFERGVSNFVCTAWPVDDHGARDFALTLYAQLLGLCPADGKNPLIDINNYQESNGGKPMHIAMREARLAIADPPNDIHTWGAYQHYGNPYFRFFAPAVMRNVQEIQAKDSVTESKPLFTVELATPVYEKAEEAV